MTRPILIDITALTDGLMTNVFRPSGLPRVVIAYICYYRTRARALIRFNGAIYIYSKKTSDRIFEFLLTPCEKRKRHRILCLMMFICTVMRSKLFYKNYCSLYGSLLFQLDQKHINIAFLRRWNISVVYMLHDIIPLQYPEYCPKKVIIEHRYFATNTLLAASGILTNSQSSLDELRDYLSCREITDLPPMIPALLAPGASTALSPKARPLPTPYFVVISTIEGRKNHLLLLQVWRDLVKKNPENAPKLVIIGRRGWKCNAVFHLLDNCEMLREHVIELSSCSDHDLVTYLFYAQALLFPSFSEGYGLPLVESLSYKTPAIVSDLKVFREIAGDIPEYVDPLDGKRWIELILEYTKPQSVMRLAQIERMCFFKIPSWNDHFATVDGFIENIR